MPGYRSDELTADLSRLGSAAERIARRYHADAGIADVLGDDPVSFVAVIGRDGALTVAPYHGDVVAALVFAGVPYHPQDMVTRRPG